MIRTLVVDDEPLARERVRQLLGDQQEIEVIGECGNGVEALEAIVRDRPDLVFLDVQMPEMDGFDVLHALEADLVPPAIIFVTAYDQYAVRAFEANAVDYLVKPLDRSRFLKAVSRACSNLRRNQQLDRNRLLAVLGERRRHAKRFAVKDDGRIIFIATRSIEWIEAAGNYVRLHVSGSSYTMRTTISGLLERLDPEQFVRVHRSTIVNLDYVSEVHPWFHGDNVVVLHNGTRVNLSRSYRQQLFDQVDRIG